MLLPAHVTYLRARGVSELTATANGVRSITTPLEMTTLAPLAYASYQAQHSPGILFPLTSPHGDLVGHQFRADSPRVHRGRTIKFDSPVGQRLRLYVPQVVRHLLCDATVPLVISEGPVRALAVWDRMRLPCISMMGVSSAVGRESVDSSTRYLADWRDGVNFLDRPVWLALDADIQTNAAVWMAAKKLAQFLAVNLHADVRFSLLPEAL